ncbi:MAG: hypothetical protein ACI8ZB_004303 [Desulforhopalus sp.]|jgi:uncharacterized protein (DUF1499 family)
MLIKDMGSEKKILLFCLAVFCLRDVRGGRPDLGVSNGQLVPCPPTSNCVNSQATDENHTIQLFYYKGTPQEAQEPLLRALKSEERGQIITANESYIRAEFTSKLFRFVDDVEFYISKTLTDDIVIDIRSASRIGSSDFGVNRKHIEQIRSNFLLSQSK